MPQDNKRSALVLLATNFLTRGILWFYCCHYSIHTRSILYLLMHCATQRQGNYCTLLILVQILVSPVIMYIVYGRVKFHIRLTADRLRFKRRINPISKLYSDGEHEICSLCNMRGPSEIKEPILRAKSPF